MAIATGYFNSACRILGRIKRNETGILGLHMLGFDATKAIHAMKYSKHVNRGHKWNRLSK